MHEHQDIIVHAYWGTFSRCYRGCHPAITYLCGYESRRGAIRLLTQLKYAFVCRIALNQDSDLSVRIGV
jgi:hypothetical protein